MIESQISNPNAAPTVWMVPSFLILTTVLALNYLGDVVRKQVRRAGERTVSRRKRVAAPGTERFADAPLDGSLLEVEEVKTQFKTRSRPRACRRRRLLHARAGQDDRDRGRVGLRQVGAVAFDHGSVAEQRRAARQHPVRGPRDRPRNGQRHAPVLGHADGDGLPGPDDVAQPRDADRQPDHGVAAVPLRRHQGVRRGDGARVAHVGRVSPRPSGACGSIRTSFPAACANA